MGGGGGRGGETHTAAGETGTERREREEDSRQKEETEDVSSEVVFTCHRNVGQSPTEDP